MWLDNKTKKRYMRILVENYTPYCFGTYLQDSDCFRVLYRQSHITYTPPIDIHKLFRSKELEEDVRKYGHEDLCKRLLKLSKIQRNLDLYYILVLLWPTYSVLCLFIFLGLDNSLWMISIVYFWVLSPIAPRITLRHSPKLEELY